MIAFQDVKIATGSADEEGRLVLADGRLVAVIVRLDDESHGATRGQWSVEAGFDGVDSAKLPVLADLDAVRIWVETQISGFYTDITDSGHLSG